MAIDGPPESPEMCHYEMSCQGQGRIMLGGAVGRLGQQPRERRRQEHPDGARAAARRSRRALRAGPGGRGEIAAEPEDQFYGDRTYRAVDPEGHRWTFAAKVRDVSKAEAEAALGQPISATNWA